MKKKVSLMIGTDFSSSCKILKIDDGNRLIFFWVIFFCHLKSNIMYSSWANALLDLSGLINVKILVHFLVGKIKIAFHLFKNWWFTRLGMECLRNVLLSQNKFVPTLIPTIWRAFPLIRSIFSNESIPTTLL